MKYIYLIFFALISFSFAEAQIVNIPDVNFKNALINLGVDINNDQNIQVSEAEIVTSLNIGNSNISDLTGIEAFINLENLFCKDNQISILDLSNNSSIVEISCNNNNLISLNISQCPSLEYINVYSNDLQVIDVTQNPNLVYLSASFNDLSFIDLSQNIFLENLSLSSNNINYIDLTQNINLLSLGIEVNPITTIDLSQNFELISLDAYGSLLETLDLSNNPNIASIITQNCFLLTSINFKNGNNTIFNGDSIVTVTGMTGIQYNFIKRFLASNCTSLNFVCVDDVNYAINTFNDVINTATFLSDCTSINSFNTIEGQVLYDIDNNNCDINDIVAPNLIISSSDGVVEYGTFTNSTGNYNLNVFDSTYETTVIGLPNYFDVLPNPETSIFSNFNNVTTVDYCVTSNQTVNEVNVVLLPVTKARPGFDAEYQILYENFGTTTLSGSLILTFDEISQTFVSANPTINNQTASSLTFNYSDLQPFESRTIDIVMNTFTPPIVNGDDILNFTAIVNPITGDQFPNDNTFNLAQIVVNSFDPNDKTVLQGSEITLSQASEYLNYVVRFQNTGTASAIKVVITDILDSKLDWETLRPVSSSHNYSLRVINGDFLEFTFDNINLPAQQDDDPGSNGFIAFKIKPKTNVQVGDIINGKANIYFDFNSPIITNLVSTEIVATLSVEDVNIENNVVIYPNPSSNIFHIKVNDGIRINSVSLYNITGNELFTSNKSMKQLDLSSFASGIYFIKIQTNKGLIVKKIIKN